MQESRAELARHFGSTAAVRPGQMREPADRMLTAVRRRWNPQLVCGRRLGKGAAEGVKPAPIKTRVLTNNNARLRQEIGQRCGRGRNRSTQQKEET